MTRLAFSVALVSVGASILSAQGQVPVAQRVSVQATPAHTAAFQPPPTFQTYCFECHGGTKHKGSVSIERLIRQSTQSSAGAYWDDWDKIAEMLETRKMPPPDEAEHFPSRGW